MIFFIIFIILFIVVYNKFVEDRIEHTLENFLEKSKSIPYITLTKDVEEFKSNDSLNEEFKTNNSLNKEFKSNEEDVCIVNHLHNGCLCGRMNYADPYMISPIDKRYFKYNYQKDLTIQDYINWLWLYSENEEELPYIHLKNYNKLVKGDKLINVPKCNIQIIKNSEEYYKKIYDNGFDITLSPENNFSPYNYNQYPTPVKM